MVSGLAVKESMAGGAGVPSGAVDGGAPSSGTVMVIQPAVELISRASNTNVKAQWDVCTFMTTPPFLFLWLILSMLADDYISWPWRPQRRVLAEHVVETSFLLQPQERQAMHLLFPHPHVT